MSVSNRINPGEAERLRNRYRSNKFIGSCWRKSKCTAVNCVYLVNALETEVRCRGCGQRKLAYQYPRSLLKRGLSLEKVISDFEQVAPVGSPGTVCYVRLTDFATNSIDDVVQLVYYSHSKPGHVYRYFLAPNMKYTNYRTTWHCVGCCNPAGDDAMSRNGRVAMIGGVPSVIVQNNCLLTDPQLSPLHACHSPYHIDHVLGLEGTLLMPTPKINVHIMNGIERNDEEDESEEFIKINDCDESSGPSASSLKAQPLPDPQIDESIFQKINRQFPQYFPSTNLILPNSVPQPISKFSKPVFKKVCRMIIPMKKAPEKKVTKPNSIVLANPNISRSSVAKIFTKESHEPPNDVSDVACVKCGDISYSESGLEEHISVVHLQYFPFKCTLCNKTGCEMNLPSRDSILSHFNRFHPHCPANFSLVPDSSKEVELLHLVTRSKYARPKANESKLESAAESNKIDSPSPSNMQIGPSSAIQQFSSETSSPEVISQVPRVDLVTVQPTISEHRSSTSDTGSSSLAINSSAYSLKKQTPLSKRNKQIEVIDIEEDDDCEVVDINHDEITVLLPVDDDNSRKKIVVNTGSGVGNVTKLPQSNPCEQWQSACIMCHKWVWWSEVNDHVILNHIYNRRTAIHSSNQALTRDYFCSMRRFCFPDCHKLQMPPNHHFKREICSDSHDVNPMSKKRRAFDSIEGAIGSKIQVTSSALDLPAANRTHLLVNPPSGGHMAHVANLEHEILIMRKESEERKEKLMKKVKCCQKYVRDKLKQLQTLHPTNVIHHTNQDLDGQMDAVLDTVLIRLRKDMCDRNGVEYVESDGFDVQVIEEEELQEEHCKQVMEDVIRGVEVMQVIQNLLHNVVQSQ